MDDVASNVKKFGLCLHVPQAFAYAEKLVAKLPEADAQKAGAVLRDLLNPTQCWAKFLQPQNEGSSAAGFHEDDENLDEEQAVVVPAGPLCTVKEGFNKATGQLFDLLLELMSGKYYSDCQSLAGQSITLVKALADLNDSDSDEVELLKQLHVLTGMFEGHTSKSVSASGAIPAPSLLTQLSANSQLNSDHDHERERAWKLVQSERRKLATFSAPKTWSKDSLLTSFRACGKVFGHNGVLNSSHRLFVASADLIIEQGDEPWLTSSMPPAGLWKEVLGFAAASATGASDFVIAFDGRMREIRRINDARLI